MFEGSLVESRGLVVSGTARWTRLWTALCSMTLQGMLAGLLIALPLFRPERLPIHLSAPPLVAPALRKPPVVPVSISRAASASTAMSLPATAAAATPVYTRGSPFPRMGAPNTDPGPELAIGLRMGDGTTSVPANMWAGSGTGFTVTRSPAAVPVRISSGVSAGMLLTTIRPVYPAIPKVAGIQGAVVMEAVISTAGRIESLHVVSGPAMLRGAALDAVQAARYQPFRLNGEPTEVATTITIVFQLGN